MQFGSVDSLLLKYGCIVIQSHRRTSESSVRDLAEHGLG